jgi:hypothetical protein
LHSAHWLSIRPLHLTFLYSKLGMQVEQFAQTVSLNAEHALTRYCPLPSDSSASHMEHGLHTLSSNSLQGEASYSLAGLQTVHCLQTDCIPNLEALCPAHLERSVKEPWTSEEQFADVHGEHFPTSDVSYPVHLLDV